MRVAVLPIVNTIIIIIIYPVPSPWYGLKGA